MHALLDRLLPKNCSFQPGFPLSLVWALSAVFVPFTNAVKTWALGAFLEEALSPGFRLTPGPTL